MRKGRESDQDWSSEWCYDRAKRYLHWVGPACCVMVRAAGGSMVAMGSSVLYPTSCIRIIEGL